MSKCRRDANNKYRKKRRPSAYIATELSVLIFMRLTQIHDDNECTTSMRVGDFPDFMKTMIHSRLRS